MHYYHRYCSLYSLPEASSAFEVEEALLKPSILSLALKAVFKDYIVERLTLQRQLALFEIFVPHRLSEPDLYLAKNTFEERILNAIQYDLASTTPLEYVKRFFEHAFSLSQLSTSAISQWKQQVEELTSNMAMLPFSLHFHPVYLAAAFLAWTRQNQNQLNNTNEKLPLTELIAGHPWFKFVDPNIDAPALESVTAAVSDEINYIFNLVSSNPPEQEAYPLTE